MKWQNDEIAKWLFYAVKKAFGLNFMQLAPGFFWVSKGQGSFDFIEDIISLHASHLTWQVSFCVVSSCHVFSFLFRDS